MRNFAALGRRQASSKARLLLYTFHDNNRISVIIKFPRAASLVLAALVLSSATQATLLDFDDLSGDNDIVPFGYGGFVWSNPGGVASMDAQTHCGGCFLGTGFDIGAISPPIVIFNGGGLSPTDIISVGGTPFTLNGAYFTSVYADQNVSFAGWLGGTPQFTSGSYAITTTSPRPIVLDWADIDRLTVYNDGALGWWAMDNFTFNGPLSAVPEPTTLALFAAGVAGLGVLRRRKARA